jgi:hypothetical protein
VPQLFAGLSNGLAPAVVVADVGWGGVIGYSRTGYDQYTHQGSLSSKTTSESESFWFAPAADVFVSRRISVGLAAGFVWSRMELSSDATAAPYSYDGFSAAITPRVGYLVPLGHGVSFWPRLGIGGSYSQNTAYSPGAELFQGNASWSLSAGLDLALVYRPTKHLMFKMAPQITVGRTVSEGGANATWSTAEGTFVRLGGEATAGLVF